MACYLAKTDPDTYAIDDLARERETGWDGVRNAQALQALRAMRKGDVVLIYHSGGESAVVGWATVSRAPVPDPGDPKAVVVHFRFRGRLNPPVSLAEIKAADQFNDWALIRQSRLSTMAVPDAFLDWLRERYPKAGF
jgi:predicted RNA-binding protein with PUA-like domain